MLINNDAEQTLLGTHPARTTPGRPILNRVAFLGFLVVTSTLITLLKYGAGTEKCPDDYSDDFNDPCVKKLVKENIVFGTWLLSSLILVSVLADMYDNRDTVVSNIQGIPGKALAAIQSCCNVIRNCCPTESLSGSKRLSDANAL